MLQRLLGGEGINTKENAGETSGSTNRHFEETAPVRK